MSRLLRVMRQFSTAAASIEKWYSKIPEPLKEKIPLLNTLQQFEDSLPVREIGGKKYKLHRQDFWVRDEDLDTMVDELEDDGVSRFAVKYLAAPTQYGKTSVALHAFLRSALRQRSEEEKERAFSHYIYLTFANNNRRHYKLVPSVPSAESVTAEDQGAEFILHCLTDAINNPSSQDTCRILLNDKPADFCTTMKALEKLIAPFEGRVLIHMDEHRQMCDHARDPFAGMNFSRGAMTALAQIPGVTVLATYTDVPPLPPQHSSCPRVPISVPILDVDAAMAAVRELSTLQKRINSQELDDSQQRLWASLRFRLALKLRSMPLSRVQVRDPVFTNFLKIFTAEAAKADLTAALVGCCRACRCHFEQPRPSENAARLLVGVRDIKDEQFHRQVQNLVVFNGLVTCDLKALLEMTDPNVSVYNTGRALLKACLHSEDVLAHRPLETAYYWALSTLLARGEVVALDNFHRIKCDELLASRVFPGTDSTQYDKDWATKLDPRTFYFADERNGKLTHPLFDWWFLTDEANVVLGDVAGGGRRRDVAEKAAALDAWIKKVQPEVKGNQIGRAHV